MSPNEKTNVHQGTLALMILKTLETMGSLHAYGLARRIEQPSGDTLEVPYGTIYPALLKLEQEGFVVSAWDTSDNNRRAKYYRLTAAGKKRIRKEELQWTQTVNIMACFLNPDKERI
ncbi:MAG TPA: PadR family transcriptional regulator [Bryobacteraceae bacterium]|nr:PadR family transcriptional regulator [Bryobacteraceae bacterium]